MGKRGAISGNRAAGARADTGIKIALTANTHAKATSLAERQRNQAARRTTERRSRPRTPPMTSR
eukprot:5611579-Pleurochrysis_carterae.AAC.1